jgi:hypothetical protein
MRFTRFLALGGLIALAGGVSPALAQTGGRQRFEFPVAFVYEGISQFRIKDYQGAISSWERYLQRSDKDADTASISWMIHQAVIQAYPEALVYEDLARINRGDPDGATVARLPERVFFETYPVARLYQGVQFYLAHQYDRASGSWEKFLVSCVTEPERAQVRELIAEARARAASQTLAGAGTP